MHNTFSLLRLSQAGNIDSNLITGQYILNLKAHFMKHRSNNPTLKQPKIAKKFQLFE